MNLVRGYARTGALAVMDDRSVLSVRSLSLVVVSTQVTRSNASGVRLLAVHKVDVNMNRPKCEGGGRGAGTGKEKRSSCRVLRSVFKRSQNRT